MNKYLMLGLLILPVGLVHGSMPWAAPDALWAQYRAQAVQTSTAAVIINVPDKQQARIGGWNIEIDKVAAGTTTVKMGVVTSITASSGTVRWFYVKTSTGNVSNTNVIDNRVLWPATIDGRVLGGGPDGLTPGASGTTPGFATGDRVTYADTEALEYQNDVPLPTTEGISVIPGVGDILIRVIGGGTTNPTTVTAQVLYYVEP